MYRERGGGEASLEEIEPEIVGNMVNVNTKKKTYEKSLLLNIFPVRQHIDINSDYICLRMLIISLCV